MTYIQPQTKIEIYRNVPLDISYRHTVKYDTAEEQYDDFQQYLYKSFDKQSYVRQGLGTIKLEATYSSLFGCNYMIFYDNLGFETKKIYCFITGIAYISNSVTAVYYQIDVMQTYMFNYIFRKSFIERNHVYNDVQGTELEPEGLELGPIYQDAGLYGYAGIGGAWHYIILATAYPDGTPFDSPKLVNGVFSGLYMYDTTSADNVASVIKTYIEQGLEDSIVSFYMGPPNSGDGNDVTMRINSTKNGNYTPRNKKLLTYPYRYLEISNNLGVSEDLKIEGLNGPNKDDNGAYWNFSFYVTCLNFPQPIMIFHPYYYGQGGPNRSFELQYSVFPTCAFSGDSFKVWWAQNKNTYLSSLNSIERTYDTSVALGSLAYQQAENSASLAKAQAENSKENSITNADIALTTAKNAAQANYNTSTGGLVAKIGSSAADIYQGVTNPSRASSAISGSLLGQVMDATGITDMVNDWGNAITNTLNKTTIQAQTTLDNANAQAQASYDIAYNTASASYANAEKAYDTALKNATLSQDASNLSALTTSQNATASLLAKKEDAMHQPSSVHGQSACDGANVYMGRVGFIFQERCILASFAQKIDDFFDLYGYAIRRMETPSVDNRKHYTYLKTTGCEIKPTGQGLDATTRKTIEGIYNNGITTWKKLAEVADYSLASDNTPLGGYY